MSERNPWFDPLARSSEQPVDGVGDAASPWCIRPLGRNRWLLLREDDPIAVLGVLSTAEWWVCPIGEALPWAETYGCRGAATRAVIVWWLHTHPFGEEG